MKTDLATSIGAAILGVIISYFVCNFFIGEMQDFSYKYVETKVDANIEEPNIEVFNYKALNPTVEVYVGTCDEYDANGDCVEKVEKEENKEEDGGNP